MVAQPQLTKRAHRAVRGQVVEEGIYGRLTQERQLPQLFARGVIEVYGMVVQVAERLHLRFPLLLMAFIHRLLGQLLHELVP